MKATVPACVCLLLGSLGGCSSVAQSTEHITPRDATLLATHVQPYLDIACASLDCHGAGDRPLRLYSELGRRADNSLRTQPVSNQHDPQPLTAAELEANRQAFAAIELADSTPDRHLALLKPLAASAGGMHHVGGVHYQSKTDPAYLCLRGWLVGDIKQDIGTMCAQANAAVKP
ncbi:MAG TPA: hypothetical protein VF331_22510 [Polyangiales bacterium]